MGLKTYQSKRRFDETPEPRGQLRREDRRLVFVIHKHAARALHYDLRLEMEGVLKSWAIPKGPSLDPSVKRLAVMVEDHPFDYKDFEGVIPEGNYGAGSVIIWDRGYYHHPSDKNGGESEQLLLEGLRKGDLKFILEGEKIGGEFALVKTGKDSKSWLLLKKKDAYASANEVLAANRSIASRRTLEEVLDADPGKSRQREKADQIRFREAMEDEALRDAPMEPMPHGIRPMLATLIKEPFDDPDWIFEIKWDGYRALAEITEGNVSLYSRNLVSFNEKFSPIRDSLRKCRFTAILDGEIVVVDERGYPDFQMLQDYGQAGKGFLLYYVFDLLHFQGHNLTGKPLTRRKDLLKKILPSEPGIRFCDHIWKDGLLYFNVVKEKGLEGIVAKHSMSTYRMGVRSRQWLKVKTRHVQEAVIGGFTEPGGRRKHLGALILGVFEGDELIFIGNAGGGFTSRGLREIRRLLDPLIQKTCPFKVEPRMSKPVTWVRPGLVCEVAFQDWTDEGIMRQPVFLRLREDKSAPEVVRENPDALTNKELGGKD